MPPELTDEIVEANFLLFTGFFSRSICLEHDIEVWRLRSFLSIIDTQRHLVKFWKK
jgi:hypothetical protein